jgi:hypothetical protein
MLDERVLAGVHVGKLLSRDAGSGGRGSGCGTNGGSATGRRGCASWRLRFDKMDNMLVADSCNKNKKEIIRYLISRAMSGLVIN